MKNVLTFFIVLFVFSSMLYTMEKEEQGDSIEQNNLFAQFVGADSKVDCFAVFGLTSSVDTTELFQKYVEVKQCWEHDSDMLAFIELCFVHCNDKILIAAIEQSICNSTDEITRVEKLSANLDPDQSSWCILQ